MITIINYGLGNLGSIQNMLRKIGQRSIITSNPEEILQSSKIILPGVGSFDTGIERLMKLGIYDVLELKVNVEKVPVLGVCLGVQLMTKSSEEGEMKGLGWFDANTFRFNFSQTDSKLSLPNMGWQNVVIKKQTPLFENMPLDARFYFAHNFYLKSNIEEDISLTSFYGHEYTVGLEKGNILGVQFHPEKSHKYGIILYNNFVNNYS
jgi:glutamine amidotransferase